MPASFLPIRAAALAVLAVALCAADIVPTDRLPTDGSWTRAGVSGGIPVRNTNNATVPAGGDIQAALNACPAGQVVLLAPNATWDISATISIPAGVVLRGTDLSSVIRHTGTNDMPLVAMGGGSLGGGVAITASATRGSTQFTVASAAGVGVGSYLAITQLNPAYVSPIGYGGVAAGWLAHDTPTRAMCQIVHVTSVSGTTIGFTPALHLDMTNSPQYRLVGMQEGSGLEDVTVIKTNPGGANANVLFSRAAGCWIEGVVSINAGHRHFMLTDSFGCTILNSALDSSDLAFDHGSGRSYGIFIFDYSSNHLIEDNVFISCRHSWAFEGGGSGCVVAYNASVNPTNGETGDYGTITEDDDTHGAHPFMNLFEGNTVSRITRDNTWGSASHNLTFRTWASAYSGAYTVSNLIFGRVAADVDRNSWYNSLVGCVLGRPGDHDATYYAGIVDYRLGEYNPNQPDGTIDQTTVATTWIHGCLSYIGNATRWEPSSDNHVIPDSMYLPGKPGWWDDGQWPGNGPDQADPKAGNPALRRYAAYAAAGSTDRSLLIRSGSVPPPAPTVAFASPPFSPASGTVGTVVVITGTGFTGITEVSFNGTAAVFSVDSATRITTTVPAGATTGTVTVTTLGGTVATGVSFTVISAPAGGGSGRKGASGGGGGCGLGGAGLLLLLAVALRGLSRSAR